MKKNLIVLLVFTCLTLVMTYPLVVKMGSHVPHDIGDPLLCSWILAWDIHKITSGVGGYWDANIFYPNRYSLAYSENLTGIAVPALPVFLITGNILFTHNLMFLLAFILSGYGAYLLVKYLTGNRMAGISIKRGMREPDKILFAK